MQQILFQAYSDLYHITLAVLFVKRFYTLSVSFKHITFVKIAFLLFQAYNTFVKMVFVLCVLSLYWSGLE